MLERLDHPEHNADKTAETSDERSPGRVDGRDQRGENHEQRQVERNENETGERAVIRHEIVRMREFTEHVHDRLTDHHRSGEAEDGRHTAGTRCAHHGGGNYRDHEGPHVIGRDRQREGGDGRECDGYRGQGRYGSPP